MSDPRGSNSFTIEDLRKKTDSLISTIEKNLIEGIDEHVREKWNKINLDLKILNTQLEDVRVEIKITDKSLVEQYYRLNISNILNNQQFKSDMQKFREELGAAIKKEKRKLKLDAMYKASQETKRDFEESGREAPIGPEGTSSEAKRRSDPSEKNNSKGKPSTNNHTLPKSPKSKL